MVACGISSWICIVLGVRKEDREGQGVSSTCRVEMAVLGDG